MSCFHAYISSPYSSPDAGKGNEGDDGPNSATDVPQIAETQGREIYPCLYLSAQGKMERFHHAPSTAERCLRLGVGRGYDKELNDPLFWRIMTFFLDP